MTQAQKVIRAKVGLVASSQQLFGNVSQGLQDDGVEPRPAYRSARNSTIA